MKNIYLWNKGIASGKLVPLLWFSAKTYFETNGTNVDLWNWGDPFIDEKSLDLILSECEKNPPDIFGFSIYVWSCIDADVVAKKIKNLYPKCLIIYGGPQNDIKYSSNFFIKRPWVDLVVPGDVYGEPILCHILSNFDSLKHSEIPEVYYQKNGITFKSKHEFVKRSFIWPKNIFKAQKKYFDFDKTNSLVIYESSRGCPYKCIYCDWGGGTYTKVVKKPLETVFSELEFLCANGIENFFIADANFGIFKEDIQIIKYLITLKKKYGYPKTVTLENAKNNLSRVLEIQELLIVNGLTSHYKISVQNPHDEIKKNIERVDIPFDEHLTAIRKLKEKYDAPIQIETILGLPGDSYQLTLDSIDLFQVEGIDSYRPSIWNLLPETPAYSPEMREKFKLQTKQFELYSFPFRYKLDQEKDHGVNTFQSAQLLLSENVIGTYSYSPKEWCDMLVVIAISCSAKTLGMGVITKYLKENYDINPSYLYDFVYKELIMKKEFSDKNLNTKLGEINHNLYRLINDPNETSIEFDIDPEFPLLFSLPVYFTFLVMLYPQDFFSTLCNKLSKKFADDKFIDLITYLTGVMIDINYDPAMKRKFICNYNWYGYYTTNIPLTNGVYEYIINDELIKHSGSIDFEYSDFPTILDSIQKTKQFFYHRASNQARKKYAQYISESRLK